jgi:hypothetical protein
VTRVIRVKDKKVLAEKIVYARIGGGIAEMHPSSNSCPATQGIFKSVFVKES